MKSSNAVGLRLEVLEDRLAPSGAFGGGINAGAPSLAPFPLNGVSVTVTGDSRPLPGFRDSLNVNHLTFVPMPSFQDQLQAFQSQMQAIQASQNAMIDQFFSQLGTWLSHLPPNVLIVV